LCVCFFVWLRISPPRIKASGVKFCTAVHRRPTQGISHFGELCSSRSQKSNESASAPPLPRRSQRLLFGPEHMTVWMQDRHVWIYVRPEDGRTALVLLGNDYSILIHAQASIGYWRVMQRTNKGEEFIGCLHCRYNNHQYTQSVDRCG